MPKMTRNQFIEETQAEGFTKAELLALILHRNNDALVVESDSYEALFDYYINQHFPESSETKEKGALVG